MSECLRETSSWMKSSSLRLNPGKTKEMERGSDLKMWPRYCLHFHWKHTVPICQSHLKHPGPVWLFTRLGWPDSSSFQKWGFHLQLSRKLCPFLPNKDLATVIHAFVTSGLITVSHCVWHWMWRQCTGSSWHRTQLPTFCMAQAVLSTSDLCSSTSIGFQSASNASLNPLT